jgi:hypothetical protein
MKTIVEHPEGTKLVPFEGGWKVEIILEVGKWYKTPRLGKALFYITKVTDYRIFAYGFDYKGKWSDEDDFGTILDTVKHGELASEEEVKDALIAEAERRGLKKGASFSIYNKGTKCIFTGFGNLYIGGENKFHDKSGYGLLFANGKFAEIISNSNEKILERIATIEKELEQLKAELK